MELEAAPRFRLALTQFEVSCAFNCIFLGRAGTCFTWADDRGTFFVTAAHVLEGAAGGDVVGLRTDYGEVKLRVADIAFADDGADVCVFAAENFRLRWTSATKSDFEVTIQLGDDLLFLGFPHGLNNTVVGMNHFVTALVRKASFSGTAMIGRVETMILDGFNNPGYSGAPVFAHTDEGHLVPVAVISGYRYEAQSHAAVYKVVDGDEMALPDTYVKPNSGMIYALPWGCVLDALTRLTKRNPNVADADLPTVRASARALGWNIED